MSTKRVSRLIYYCKNVVPLVIVRNARPPLRKYERKKYFRKETAFVFVLLPRARICKLLRSQEIDSKEFIPPVYVAWRTGMSNKVVVQDRQGGNRFLGSFKGLQIRALEFSCIVHCMCAPVLNPDKKNFAFCACSKFV